MFFVSFFFFTDTATTQIYTLSLHDALPISVPSARCASCHRGSGQGSGSSRAPGEFARDRIPRSEEHTSELQSHVNLVCRLLLEKKKSKKFKQSPLCHKKIQPTHMHRNKL